MFETSSNLTTCIAIYPNSGDDWNTLPPFTGESLVDAEEAYVISNSLTNNVSESLHLLQSRLSDVGKISNQIDFLFKTNTGQNKIVESSGIGGFSKLKDFTFSMSKGLLDIDSILQLYGRKIVVYLTNTTGIEDPDGVKSVIRFVGKIYSAKREKEIVKFTVKGLLNIANPMIEGNKVTSADGSIQNESLIFGDAGGMYIPIVKVKDSNGNFSLQFSNSDEYIIRGFYIKAGSDSDPIYAEIDQSYTITNNKINFESLRSPPVYLIKSLMPGGDKVKKLQVEAYNEIGLHIRDGDDIPTLVEGEKYLITEGFFSWGETITKYLSDHNSTYIMYDRKETFGGEDTYIFKAGWELIYGGLRTEIENGDSTEATIFTSNNTFRTHIDSISSGWLLNPLEKEIDALPFDSDIDTWAELKYQIEKYGTEGFKTFQSIPNNGLVIRIEDEEMLVVYTDKFSSRPTFDTPPNNPSNQYIYVVRGWNGTDMVEHSSGREIHIAVKQESFINYSFDRPLKTINTLTSSDSFKFSNIQNFLNGSNVLCVHSNLAQVAQHDITGFIGLDFNLPSLEGDITSVTMSGRSFCSASKGQPNVSSCNITLAMNAVDDQDDYIKRRRVIGSNTYMPDKNLEAYLSNQMDTTLFGEGEYNLVLDTVWDVDLLEGGHFLIEHNRTKAPLDLGSYDDFKKSSFYITFRASNFEGGRSNFTISRPTMTIKMEASLENVDVYAKVIPKSFFDIPVSEETCGTNCKIAWHPIREALKVGTKNIFTVIDDDVLRLGRFSVCSSYLSNYVSAGLSDPANEGIIVNNLVESYSQGKLHPNLGFLLWYYKYNTTPFTGTYAKRESLDVGETFIESGDTYVWVDQENNKIKTARKSETGVGNPVTVIETLLGLYLPSVDLDTASFTVAKTARSDWNCRVLVTDSIALLKLIDMIAKEHGLVVFEDTEGKISIATLNPPAEDEIEREITSSELKFKGVMLDFKEKFTNLDYIITAMDVYYNFINNKYNGLIDSSQVTDQQGFEKAQEYSTEEIKVKLNLRTVFQDTTADNSALVKMAYHSMPTRILTIGTSYSTNDIKIGNWININSTKFSEAMGKIYLVIAVKEQIPLAGKKSIGIDLLLFEYDWDAIKLRIQEVPSQDVVDNYDEVVSTTDEIEETPDAS